MGLRLPDNLDRIGSLSTGDGPYPPRAFAMFDDHALGNGDTYGLYWPFGSEASEPLVLETSHDAWALVPAFSSMDRFLEITAELEEEEYAEWPSVDVDPDAPHACYTAARAALKAQSFENAAHLLVRAIARLPEYTAALSLLSSQSLRKGDHAEACRLAIRAVRSPPSFAFEAEVGRIWAWLARQTKGPADIATDPIWVHRAALSAPPSGAAKENAVYPVLMTSIDAYAGDGNVVAALTLMQTYAEFMCRETVAFQERHGFNAATHRDRQSVLESILPTGLRAIP